MGSKRKRTSEKGMTVQLDDIYAGLIPSAELAAKLHVSERTLRTYRKRGLNGARIKRVKLHGKVFYDRRSAENFIDASQPDGR